MAWTDECGEAFRKMMIVALTSQMVLKPWAQGLPTRIMADASDTALGAVSEQKQVSGNWTPRRCCRGQVETTR